MLRQAAWIFAVALSLIAGYTDWRSRRIPNWLTLPGMLIGIACGWVAQGWVGAKDSLLGIGLGLALLLPFVLIRILGAGDWKLIGALGAFLGPQPLLAVLMVTVLVNGVMALAMIIWKGRARESARNFGRLLAALGSMQSPGRELTLDNPDAVKVPFGVAVAVAMLLFGAAKVWMNF